MQELIADWRRTAPLRVWIVSIAITLGVLVVAWFVMPDFVDLEERPGFAEMAGITLVAFFFPALFEEAIFRGILNPTQTWLSILFSTSAFILWHPLGGYLAGPEVAVAMNDLRFLFFVAVFGVLFCLFRRWGRSIWVPIVCHWIIIVVWKGLGGARFGE